MANTKITLYDQFRSEPGYTTILAGDIDPYWATLLGATFNALVDGESVGLGTGPRRAAWRTMVPTLEAPTNPRVDAAGFLRAYVASAARSEMAEAVRDLVDAKNELPRRLAGKNPGELLPNKTGFIAELRGKGYDAPVMRNWLGWALGRFGTAAALTLPPHVVDVNLTHTRNQIRGGLSYDGFVEIALAAWPPIMGAQPPAGLVRLMRLQNPVVGDVTESLAAIEAFGSAVAARIS